MVEMGVPEPEEAEESVQVEVSGADRTAEPEQQMGNHSEQEEAAVRQKVFARRCSPKGVRQKVFGKRCSPEGVRQKVFARRCSAKGVRQKVFAKRCSDKRKLFGKGSCSAKEAVRKKKLFGKGNWLADNCLSLLLAKVEAVAAAAQGSEATVERVHSHETQELCVKTN
ncbi:hypothetical protein SASPL_157506 [Salvia splendens]|uniref:Uncharacterized protein n=1 Tax=Salvia splendens TaxID=180675 RepID=A0A8X8YUW6_SALSN|nr:hypothetical protein SASPL_157506 [Salvia splendens]